MAQAMDVTADWNVIVTVPEATFREARKFLCRWGEVRRDDLLRYPFLGVS
jgi:hypothetical protein